MMTKLNFIWSKTPDDLHHGVVHIHREDGELMHRAAPVGSVDLTPGRYRLQVRVAGRQPADSNVIDLSGPYAEVDLDSIVALPPAPKNLWPLSTSAARERAPFRRIWQVETWTGNLLTGSLQKETTLGQWDGRDPVGLPAKGRTSFVRVAALDAPEDLLIAVPASRNRMASLSALGSAGSKDVRNADDRALMRVEPENASARMLLDLLDSGDVSDALSMAPNVAAELIEPAQKRSDPVAGAIGCYFLLGVLDPSDDPRGLWPVLSRAVRNLAKYESWLPDSAVLSASVEAIEGDYKSAALDLRRLESGGPPIITSGLTRAIDLIRGVAARCGDDDPERPALNWILTSLVDVAVAGDLSKRFLTLRNVNPAGGRTA